MRTHDLKRLLPLGGVLFAACLVAGLALTNGEPDNGAPRAHIVSYWHDHYGRELVSSLILIPFASVFLLALTIELRRVLRDGEAGEAIYSTLALAGGILTTAGLGVTGSLGAAVATAAHHGSADATYTLAQLQSYDWVPWMIGFGILLLASGAGGLRTHSLPKLLAWPAVALGAACLTPLGFFALFAIPVWMFAAGIVLFRAQVGGSRALVGSLATFALTIVVLSVVGAASATAPGHNGSIAFRRFFDDQHTWAALYTVAADGTHTRQVTHPARGTVDNSPDWSPDGRLIAFIRFDATNPTSLEHLWTVHADGSGLAPVGPVCPSGADETTCPDDTDPSFAFDSTRLTFVQASGTVKNVPGTGPQIEHSAIAIANVDGSNRHVIYQPAPFSSDLAGPMLSPHGAAIVFERDNSGAARPAGAKAVFVIRSDGLGGARRLTPWADNAGDNPDWSPDGNWILFHTHFDDGRQGQYFLIHPDGSGRKQISHYPDGTFLGSASFSPDGRSIVFAKGPQGGNIDVYTMRIDGTHVRRVTRSKLWDSAPDWGSAPTSADRATASARAGFPTGTWRVVVTTHDLVSRGVTGSDVPGNRGVWDWTFSGNTFVEKQHETATGPVTDVHHGRISFKGARVCFTDTGEKVSLGCYAWTRNGSKLRFTRQSISGSLAAGDGPGILKAVFTAHPWVRIGRTAAQRAPASASVDGLIAFTRYRLQDSPLWSEIWVARPDGSHALKVSRSPKAAEDDQAHFSPRGDWIVFDRCMQDTPCSVWLVRPNGTGQRRVRVACAVGTCDDSNASFAPDGKHLVMQHEWGAVRHGTIPDNDQIEHSSIVETKLDGSHPVVLRELDNWRGGLEAPRLTPNGRMLLFRSYVWHLGRITPDALFVAPRTGGPARRITPLKLWASGGEISPNGRTVLFRSTFESGELTPGNAMYSVGIDGRNLRRLIPASFSSYVLTGSYSPDGNSVVFATDDGATGSFADIFTLDLATGARGRVTRTKNLDGWPSWGR